MNKKKHDDLNSEQETLLDEANSYYDNSLNAPLRSPMRRKEKYRDKDFVTGKKEKAHKRHNRHSKEDYAFMANETIDRTNKDG